MLTKNSGKWLDDVLSPIKEQQEDFNINMVVVDGLSIDGTPEVVKGFFPNSIIVNSKSRNLATLRNTALRIAHENFPDADYMSFIDSDVVVPLDFFRRCIKLLSNQNRKVGIVGVRFELEKNPKHFVSKFYRDRRDIIRNGIHLIDYTTTACSVWKAYLSKNIVLDERLARAGEDVDFNLQITNQGYVAMLDANPEPAWHIRHATVREELHRVKDHGLARAYLFKIHKYGIFPTKRKKTILAALLILSGYIGLLLTPFIGVIGVLPFVIFYLRHWLKCRDKRRLDFAFFGFLMSVIFFTRFIHGTLKYTLSRVSEIYSDVLSFFLISRTDIDMDDNNNER